MIDIELRDKDKARLAEIDAELLKWARLQEAGMPLPPLYEKLYDLRGMLESLLFDIKYHEE